MSDHMLVQWGAGNIGRSFIGQIFARSGYRVTCIDIDDALIQALNENQGYVIKEVSQEGVRMLPIKGVSAVNGRNRDQVNEAIASCSLLSVSVGKQVLPHIAAQLAQALIYRYQRRPGDPVNLIISENIHNGASYMRNLLEPYTREVFKLDEYVGLVETSIGKMVPIQTGGDPLVLTAEPYNTLYVDRDGFIGGVPDCPYLRPVRPITAYVERKLYIHNLGHAAAAYIGFQKYPHLVYLPDVLEDADVLKAVREVMDEAAQILLKAYPQVFTETDLNDHIEDLLYRFQNRALGDTLYRVGRDLGRKLRWDDRVLGAVIKAEELGLSWRAIGKAYLAGLAFRGTDSEGKLFPADEQLLEQLSSLDLRGQLELVSGLDKSPLDKPQYSKILDALCSIYEKGV